MSKNVLVVEDEGIVSLELREQLEHLGHQVVGVADTGEQAVELAHSTHPDLVLMDIRLKGDMDGADAAAIIRKTSDVPIVFLTAYSGDDILQRAMQSEPYGYLVKPIQEQQLYGALRVVWHKHQQDSIRKQNARRFSSIVRALPHGIILTDEGLKVRYLNTQAKRRLDVASTRAVWGRSILEILIVQESGFEDSLRAAAHKVLENRQSAFLGEYQLRADSAGPTQRYTIEVSPFTDTGTELHGILVTFSEPFGEQLATPPLWAEMETLDRATAVDRLGELRSFLELEIIRLSLEDSPEESYTQGFQTGQVEANKRILELIFGPDALREMEQVVDS